jgi:hypothetical protein
MCSSNFGSLGEAESKSHNHKVNQTVLATDWRYRREIIPHFSQTLNLEWALGVKEGKLQK